MASKRMFTMKIVDSDAFLDMPLSTQCLYFHLCMRADDDGFISNPKRVSKLIGCNDDDLKLLITKRFVLWFESGVIVIKHWRMHNWIRKDRYTPTVYQEELKKLAIKSNESYTNNLNDIPSDNQMTYQVTTSDIDIDLDKDIDKKEIYKEKSEFEITMDAFKEMRKKIRHPLTDYGEKLIRNRLEKLAPGNEEEQIKILQQSIEASWQGIYELKKDEKHIEKKERYEMNI